jgi:hypothetical protein
METHLPSKTTIAADASACPFCASTHVGVDVFLVEDQLDHRCRCLACGTAQRGAAHATAKLAVDAWNTRHSPVMVQVAHLHRVDGHLAVCETSNASGFPVFIPHSCHTDAEVLPVSDWVRNSVAGHPGLVRAMENYATAVQDEPPQKRAEKDPSVNASQPASGISDADFFRQMGIDVKGGTVRL